MSDLGMSKATSGFLATLTLLASGIGGVMFGFLADRIGRKRALMLSILTYSLCSFASGLSTSILMLAVFRFILGLGMGGEWNTGATLVAETWPTELRAKDSEQRAGIRDVAGAATAGEGFVASWWPTAFT